ncbi:AAA family ATPase [Priestia aryabhattai]|uniref:AAA family ATPase n=1 Tax=Priestia aryabhattai TaxID=412384 RepID=UPI001CCBBAC3|nr:ATP-binding protein [Priestia aryabhattai]MBZ6485094.1 AAA family ATPase [Priestia aryabhattai]
MLRINSISINGINGIEKLGLSFNDGFNLICGNNGIGKTTILDCIASSFNRNSGEVRKNVKFKGEAHWTIEGDMDDNSFISHTSRVEKSFKEKFNLEEQLDTNGRIRYHNAIRTKDIVNFSIARTTNRRSKVAPSFSSHIQYWMYKNDDSILSSVKRAENSRIAKECFSRLNPVTQFSKVVLRYEGGEDDKLSPPERIRKRNSADIYVNTPTGEIPFDFLSSGYRACLTILLGIISQTEVTSGYKSVQLFDGVILIDELDLHLHPAWQAKLIEILRWLIPNAQIIATTHSPHIIQVAKQEEVIALAYQKPEVNEISQKSVGEYGLQGWTIEEILQDIMGMEDVHSQKFKEILDDFSKALTNLETQKAEDYYKIIDSMLHPENHLRKLLKLQMAPLEKIKK